MNKIKFWLYFFIARFFLEIGFIFYGKKKGIGKKIKHICCEVSEKYYQKAYDLSVYNPNK